MYSSIALMTIIAASYYRIVDGSAGFFTLPATVAIIYLVFRFTNKLIKGFN